MTRNKDKYDWASTVLERVDDIKSPSTVPSSGELVFYTSMSLQGVWCEKALCSSNLVDRSLVFVSGRGAITSCWLEPWWIQCSSHLQICKQLGSMSDRLYRPLYIANTLWNPALVIGNDNIQNNQTENPFKWCFWPCPSHGYRRTMINL